MQKPSNGAASERLKDRLFLPEIAASAGLSWVYDAVVLGKIRQGCRVPGEGSPGPARILRFPRRTLETPADLEPDREYLCHRAAPHDPLAFPGCQLGAPAVRKLNRAHFRPQVKNEETA